MKKIISKDFIFRILMIVMSIAVIYMVFSCFKKPAANTGNISRSNENSIVEKKTEESSSKPVNYIDKDERKEVKVPIIMYHSISENESMFCDYVVSPALLEQDIKYFQSKGYTAVFVNDLIRYVRNGEKLPEKPIVVSFDDGFYNNLALALPVLENCKCKAVISVVGEYTELAERDGYVGMEGSYLTLNDIDFLRSTGIIEISNHTYAMHSIDGARKGCGQKDGESAEDYRTALYNDLFTLQQMMDTIGFRPNVFAYPYGIIGENAPKIVRSCGFSATLGCGEKVNTLSVGDDDCLYGLGRYNRAYGKSPEEFFKNILE